MLQLLTFTSLYPNCEQPSHGVFVENRLRHLVGSGQARTRIVAPVPYFPFGHKAFGSYGMAARVPASEVRFGVQVDHPRFPLIPKVGMGVAAQLMYHGVRRAVRRIAAQNDPFHLIDAHYFYPDGVAAALLARDLGLPFVITGRGSDLSELTNFARPRAQILWAASQAAALITVCQALKDKLVSLGVAPEKIFVFRNGVDLEAFQPGDRLALRARYDVQRRLLLSVGHLIPRKGHDLVISALVNIPDTDLFILGEGPERASLEALAAKLGVADRVRFLGHYPHDKLKEFYCAADALVLASDREGWANVLLEAMACGTPVVATDVWGTREVVQSSAAGLLAEERSVASLTNSIKQLLGAPPDRAATRAYAEGFSWCDTTQNQLDLFARIAKTTV